MRMSVGDILGVLFYEIKSKKGIIFIGFLEQQG